MLNLNLLIIFIFLNVNLYSYNRAVLLSPAVADIFVKLHIQNKVVGVTKHIRGFKNAVKVGTHIRPNLEIIKSLRPDVIFISSYRFFPKSYISKLGNVRVYVYNPLTVDEIFYHIKKIGKLFDREMEAEKLVCELKSRIKMVKKLKYHPKVVYEIMENPYYLAGRKNIVNDIIEKAGGMNLIKDNKKLVLYSPEKVRFLNLDVYIYQVGPMNRNPVPPLKRVWFKGCRFKVLKVDEIKFARPNTNVVDNILFLNRFFSKIKK